MNYRNLVDEIVDGIIVALPLDSRVRAANLNQNDFQTLKLLVVSYIRNRLDQMHPVLKKELIVLSYLCLIQNFTNHRQHRADLIRFFYVILGATS